MPDINQAQFGLEKIKISLVVYFTYQTQMCLLNKEKQNRLPVKNDLQHF